MNPLDSFEGILGPLHRAALRDACWPAATALIEEACGAVCSTLRVGEGGNGVEPADSFIGRLRREAPEAACD